MLTLPSSGALEKSNPIRGWHAALASREAGDAQSGTLTPLLELRQDGWLRPLNAIAALGSSGPKRSASSNGSGRANLMPVVRRGEACAGWGGSRQRQEIRSYGGLDKLKRNRS